MDFLDPNKKRSNKIKLYVGYLLVAIAISMAALVLLFANAGYRLDKDGKITQNSLLFVASHPSGAQAYIEGLYSKYKTQGKTDTKFDLQEGRYRVTIQKNGYRSWQREMSLEGGSVERLAYPFLFPEKLDTKDLKEYSGESGIVSSSPDRKWIIVQNPDNLLSFDIFNTSDITKPNTNFSIPKGILSTGANQRLEIVEWSSDNSNILMKHSFNSDTEYVIINKDKPETSLNINALTGQKPSGVSLKDRKIDQVYLHMASGGLLQQVDTKTKLLTPIVPKALAYKSHGDDMLVYVTPSADDEKQVSVHIATKDKDFELRKLPVADTYLVDVARFDNSWYIVVGASSDNKVYVYKDPLNILAIDNPKKSFFARTLRIENPKHVSFSANARVIAVQSGQSFAVYDAETDRQYRYQIKEQFDTERYAEWMDGHRLASSTGKNALVFDFDGINQQKLMPINPKTDVMFDRDYENAFSFDVANQNNKSHLTQTKLLVDN